MPPLDSAPDLLRNPALKTFWRPFMVSSHIIAHPRPPATIRFRRKKLGSSQVSNQPGADSDYFTESTLS